MGISNGVKGLFVEGTKVVGEQATAYGAGIGVSTLAFFVDLPSLANGDILTTYVPGYAFKILSVDFRVHTPVTTASKAADINLEIGTTNLTGGVVGLTSATCTPRGAAVAGSAVTAANTGTITDSFSIEAANVTTFVEGSGWIIIKIQNMDEANAWAALTTHGLFDS